MADWQLFARTPGPRYGLNGGLPLVKISGVLRHLGVDTAVVETPYSPEAFARTGKGCGVVAYRGPQQLFSGLIASERTLSWDEKSGQPTIRVQCVGDNVHLRGRIVFPDPARTGTAQSTAAYWTASGVPTSTAMLQLISASVGPTARVGRRVAGLSMGPDPALGAVRSHKWRFENVLDALADMAVRSGVNLGVRTETTSDGLLTRVYEPQNKVGTLRFSADLGNLAGFEYTDKPPTVTYALAGGQGDLTARLFADASATDPADLEWGLRIEQFVDQNNEDVLADLQAAAADAVVAGAGSTSLAVKLTDSTAATYGVDWGPGPGDLVTVYVGLPGQVKPVTVSDVVREIAFEVDSKGVEKITPAIGTSDATAIPPGITQTQLRAVGRRLQTLEARK